MLNTTPIFIKTTPPAKVLDDLNAKAALRQLFAFERLFGWSALALTYVDYAEGINQPLLDPQEIRELVPYSSLNCTVQSSDEAKEENYQVVREELQKIYFCSLIRQ